MKIPKLLTASLVISALALTASAAESGFKSLFNGKDLTGWEGMSEFWSVRDGVITGVTTKEHQPAANTFLVWKGGELKNFDLRVRFRLTGQNESGWGNSGVQYRSKILDAATFVVGGYQADIDSPFRYTGMLYEEKGRGILMTTGEKIKIGETTEVPDTKKKKDGKRKQTAVEKLPGATPTADIQAAYKLGEWNEIRIVAEGNHLRHYVNDTLTADVIDTDNTLGAKAGVLALQLHRGQAMTIEFKDIRLKTLP